MKHEPKVFWNKKILGWEKDKYFSKNRLLMKIDVNASIKMRMNLARAIFKKIAMERSLLELGCGSALLLEDILSSGAHKYTGIDISSIAIETAKQRTLKTENTSKLELITQNVSEIKSAEADICFSLGLFDWVSLEDIASLQKRIKSKYYLHSFSEKRPFSPHQIFHRIYVYLLYGHKNSHYVPRYYTEAEIAEALNSGGRQSIKFFRHSDLSFGCFAYCLPQTIEDLM